MPQVWIFRVHITSVFVAAITVFSIFVTPLSAETLSSPFSTFSASVRESVVTVASATIEKVPVGKRRQQDQDPGNKRSISSDRFTLSDDFTDQILKAKPGKTLRQLSSMGSGFIIDPSGLILTNNHVIDVGDAIYIVLHDGTELEVEKIVGRDVKTDIALLKVTPKPDKPLRAVHFGDSSNLRIGDWLIAIGNPFGLSGTVTAGILSGIGRDINAGPYDEFLQTDASINRGNSGGPLFNSRGEVVGINTAIFSPSGGSIGLGFAIPSNTVRRVLDQLQIHGEVKWGTIGVRIQSVPEDLVQSLGLERPEGALIARVNEGGAGAQAGLAEGDVIVTFAGSAIKSARQFPRAVSQWRVGDEVDMVVLRNKQRLNLRVKIGLQDDKSTAATKKADKTPPAKRQKLSNLEFKSLSEEFREAFSLLPHVEGVVVTGTPLGVFSQHGLKNGDVILEAAHQKIRTLEEFHSRIQALRQISRTEALLTVMQPGGTIDFVSIDLRDD